MISITSFCIQYFIFTRYIEKDIVIYLKRHCTVIFSSSSHSLSHDAYHLLSLVVPFAVTRCHSLYHSLSLVYHSLSLAVIRCVTFLISVIYLIVKMQNICNLIGWNSVHIFDIFNCYRANINGKRNAGKLGTIYKTFEFTLT